MFLQHRSIRRRTLAAGAGLAAAAAIALGSAGAAEASPCVDSRDCQYVAVSLLDRPSPCLCPDVYALHEEFSAVLPWASAFDEVMLNPQPLPPKEGFTVGG